MSTVKRISLSVPVALAEDLDYIHRRVGVSKSALVSELLTTGIGPLRELLETLPQHPTPDDLVRFRGASAEVAQARINALQTLIDGDDFDQEDSP